MECGVCDIRSSIGYCIECQKLLCETCSETCDQCGKLMCPDHVYESRSGKVYCTPCNERRKSERKSKRKRQHGVADDDDTGTSLEALDGAAPLPEEEEEPEGEARVLARREPTQPWQVCVYTAVAALAIAIVLLIFPSLRRVPLGGTNYLPTPYVLLIIPMIAAFWGVYGIVNIEFYRFRQRCMAGIGVALLSMVMFVVEVATDPAAHQEAEASDLQERRDDMSEEQLENWRGNVLDKYQ